MRINGSHGIAEIQDCQYTLQRFRLPPSITLREASTDELVARFCLLPRNGLVAEFNDGESFHLGWVQWWKREWCWTDDIGEPVLCSRYQLFGPPKIVAPNESGGLTSNTSKKWPLLAVLELAMGELGVPYS